MPVIVRQEQRGAKIELVLRLRSDQLSSADGHHVMVATEPLTLTAAAQLSADLSKIVASEVARSW
jgi:hypothetical protein|tara:strand:+ start:336 stop:530 length:195 start_codon:yes stop_codon:yes gene_type:complete